MNEPQNIVDEMLEGFVFAHEEIEWFPNYRVVALKEKKKGKVGIMSVGGSGHEPAHAGYVGKGMLDAAVAGNLFASPSPDQMLKAMEEINTGAGVLVVLKNYSGDLMNYSVAKELAQMKGIEVECVVVKDDVAVPDSTYSTGRRGIAGTIFVHKIAGAKANEGASLQEVKEAAEIANANIRSIGMSMTACTLPGLDKPGFTVADDEIEIGMGIHGEPGIQKTKIKKASELAEIMLAKIIEDYDYSESEIALMINGLGATPLMELYVFAGCIQKLLKAKRISAHKVLVGNYMTSLDMAGCSITMFKLDKQTKRLLDAPCNTPGLKFQKGKKYMFALKPEDFIIYLKKVAKVIEENKEYITELDSETGDGDHWLNMNIGFQKLVEKTGEWKQMNFQELFQNIAMVLMSAMGGSSGVLYGSAYLKSSMLMKDKEIMDEMLFGEMLLDWAEAIASRGNAKPGYKTMLDAIYPAANAYQKSLNEGNDIADCLHKMVMAAKQGADSTREMEAVKGRASYREDKSVGYLDPGAVTMAMQLECMAECFANCNYN